MRIVWLIIAVLAGLAGIAVVGWAIVAWLHFLSMPIQTGMDIAAGKGFYKVIALAGILLLTVAAAAWSNFRSC